MRDYFELKDEMLKVRKAQKGDQINCQGLTCTIDEIYYSDRYVEEKDGDYHIFYDIEFIDTRGEYRHWKSMFDGGHLILA